MYILALDTCLAACSAAIVRDDSVLAWTSEPMVRGHQERLGSLTDDLLMAAELAFSRIDRVGVTVGPGSFTGLRVGLAFAKGLALALGKPCVGVGVLEALNASVDGAGQRAVAIDAGRGRIYLQMFDNSTALTGPDILPLEVALSRLVDVFPGGQIDLIGPGATLLSGGAQAATVRALSAPDPKAIARLAGKAALAPPRPLYLRPADAKAKAA